VEIITDKDIVKATWPSAGVAFCGDKIKDRLCNDKDMNPDGNGGPFKVSFGKNKVDGYNFDNG